MMGILLKFFPKSLRAQLISGIGLFLTCLIVLFMYIQTTNNVKILLKRGVEQASSHSDVLASMVKIWVMSNDYAGLEEALENFSIYDDLVFAAVVNMDGKIIAHTDNNLVGQYIADAKRIKFLQQSHADKKHDFEIYKSQRYLDVLRVVHNKNEDIGIVHLRFDRSERLALVKRQIYEAIGFGIFYLIVTFLMLYYIVNTFTTQLEVLLQAMKKVHDGNRNVRADERGYNELSELSRQFNRMLGAIVSGEKELKQVKERLEYAVNGANDGIWDWDIVTGEVYFSPRWKEMLGYSDSELDNAFETWETRVHPDDLEESKNKILFSHTQPGLLYVNLHRIRHKDGSWVWVLARGQTIFDTDGKAVRMVGIHTDMTKQKQLEDELANQEEMMIAQSRHVAMGEMIGMIAHQWRQPITIIAMGANNLLLDVELDEITPEHTLKEAKEIVQQTEYLSKTIDDFRNFFRPNKEKDEIKVTNVLMEAQQIVGKSLEYHNIVLSITGDERGVIETYSRELLQVFLNIIKNAQEAIEQNGVQQGRIDIHVEDRENDICITIADDGGGADENTIRRMFEPYFSTKDKKTGTGLGLHMSKTIIEKHLGGSISAYNKGKGLEFRIIISKRLEGGVDV